ncbi:hypothetical protein HZ992_15250 [Rhizobacter sp. AJA081-3]|uniref:hypothetical protein n=1 Tax=Rhizobacter sp. AJA081-3 TaxID=2753607 RepID=UPI001ADEF136|nr:hypothetical protein [Rhizobacter sp. AJA081-3]QTN21537.1 hypothetical protein HZ992_15250 [Rhizobacter sp. AJA081-3]
MPIEIVSQSFTVGLRSSKSASSFGLIVSFRELSNGNPRLVIGAPGQPNVVRVLQLGDAVLYETTAHGLIEVRLAEIRNGEVDILVTRVSPRLGFTAGLDETDVQNAPFALDEIAAVRKGVEAIRAAMVDRDDVEPEKLELLTRKLEEIASAAQRMGRKDWTMFVAGTLTNIIVGAAFAPDAARALLVATNSALGWVLQNAIRLLPM